MNRKAKLSSIAARALAFAGLLCVGVACSGGPERAPHTPVKGVDTEKNEVENPGDEKAPSTSGTARTPTGRAPFLDSFTGQVAAAHQAQPGMVAVFPALTREPNSSRIEVTGLGGFLMEETASALEAEGVTDVVSGPELVRALHQSNRGLDSLQRVDDVYGLAERIGATYVVFGTAEARTFDRLGRDQKLEIRWTAKRVADRHTIASYDEDLSEGALAQSLYRYQQSPSAWKVGAEADKFDPSLQLEARMLGRELARTIATANGGQLRDRAVRIEPTVVTSRSGARAKVQEFAAEFERRMRETQRSLAADPEAVDIERAALSHGPVTIQGQDYQTLGDAVDAFRRLRNETQTSAVGDLENDVSTALGEELRTAMEGKIRILAGDAERDLIMNVLRREARASRVDESVDPNMLTRLRSDGTQILILSTLRQDLESYQLRGTVVDLATGEQVSHSVSFDSRFDAALKSALDR